MKFLTSDIEYFRNGKNFSIDKSTELKLSMLQLCKL